MSDDPNAALYSKFNLPEAHGHIAGIHAVLESTLRALLRSGTLSEQQLREVLTEAKDIIERAYPPSTEQTIFPPFHSDRTKDGAVVAINLLGRALLETPSGPQAES